MTVGFVYLLANHCMPGIYKIGMTERSPTQRCNELSASTSVPDSFTILFYVEVDNPLIVERSIHQHFDNSRVSFNREFFRCEPVDAYEWLRCNADIYTEHLDGDIIFELQKSRLKIVEGGQ